MQADDNAEHLYRYIAKHHKEIKIFFILRKTSHDWFRLRKDGFRLIAFGSLNHGASLLNAKHLISSHANGYVSNYLQVPWYNDLLKIKYTFLQHGVTKDDMSNWFNTKDIHCLITASKREYNSIVSNYTRYKFTEKEVMLTGFPRHDTLLKGANKREKLILIMPTWRQSLVGKLLAKGDDRGINKKFLYSKYVQYWKSLLHSQKLRTLCEKHGYQIIFFPHANIQPYLKVFNIPSNIELLSHNSGSIQTLFQRASLLITDYSSVAFEMAVLEKETIYYQFDKEEIFRNIHTYEQGYFDYKKDGFGAVCYQENEVLEALENYFKRNGKIDMIYQNRMREFFAFHDMHNSKRTFEAIQNLDS